MDCAAGNYPGDNLYHGSACNIALSHQGMERSTSSDDTRWVAYAYTLSCYSLFPLLFEAQEYPIKVLLLLLHSMLMWLGFSAQFTKCITMAMAPSGKIKDSHSRLNRSVAAADRRGFVIGWVYWSYLVGLLLVEIWGQILHPMFLGDKLPFVPLMLISIYCSLGVMYSFLWQLKWILDS
ncbi:hypothetical protein M0R45_035095 [Rubus argutus]|uniref:Alpha-1,3-glucosyltransferase n=1 Tax=Rubus argutus TaxID=59490 RepID=A0AAW1VS35_RUBAR